MTKALVAALLAASSILPGAAAAQAPQDRGDRPQLTEAQRQARAERRAERQSERQPDRQGDRQTARGGRDGMAYHPPVAAQDRPDRRAGRADDARPPRGDDRGGRFDGGRYDRGGRPDGGDRVREGDRFGRDGRDGRYDRDDRAGWNGRSSAYTQRFGGAQRWSNDWRRDGRYDWNRYRSYNREAFRLPRYYAPGGWGYGYRRFGVGVRIAGPLFGRNYWIADPWAYRLPPAYGPYRWVRYFNDALLIDVRTGSVVDAEYGIFW